MTIARRRVLAALAGVVVLPVFAACTARDGAGESGESADTDVDCDADDLAERDPDCGYYDSDSRWHLYPWVVAGKGGKPPAGKKPVPPSGVKPNPPRTGGGSGARTGSGSRTGGKSSPGSGRKSR